VNDSQRVAVVTGASAGFGEATAEALARDGFKVVVAARRYDRVAALAERIGGIAFELDVRDRGSIERFAASVESAVGAVSVLVNNAGLALGSDPVENGSDDDWVQMWETNVLGILRMTKAFIPLLRKAGDAHVVNIGSVAGFNVYKGGAGYTSTKHAVRAITETLRLELNGETIRVSEVDPGMSETEFSLVRYKGDETKAGGVYDGVTPLSAADVAECVAFVISRPRHVNIDFLVVKPLAQAASYMIARGKPGM
jgi:NADP-dependent 3-hydroxy acid dehydrogenase YdfG